MHNLPMEPHATIAVWEGGSLTIYDANQGALWVQRTIAAIFGLELSQVRVIAPARRRRLRLEGDAPPRSDLSPRSPRRCSIAP